MEEREFVIEIRGRGGFLTDLDSDLHRPDTGGRKEEAVERVFFKSIDAANRLLTPKRIELLLVLHDEGPMNTHELSKRLERDCKSVRQDILALHEVGLVTKKRRALAAPWKKISMELRMAA